MRRTLLVLALAGCARYEPAPIEPSRLPAEWAARTLEGDTAWSVPSLALASWRLRPELEAARLRWDAVRAAEITAGRRPPVGVVGGVEYGRDPGPFEDPWSVGISAILRFELGGKRGARVAAAQARTLEAELAARTLAHRLASDAREAALAVA
ncbi:MAG TPA: TolC family protein, partial [Gemmatimonadales bacterium]|nr:TolC family protein [Gemmatimonadales bacterium]